MATENSTEQKCYYRDEACEILKIKPATYYKRINFLGIEPRKDGSRGKFITENDLHLLQELENHVKQNGKIRSYFNPQKMMGN